MDNSFHKDDDLIIDISNSIISEDNIIYRETTTEENTPDNSYQEKELFNTENHYKEFCIIAFIFTLAIILIVGLLLI